MSETVYVDLPDFGLRFVPFEDARFPMLLNEILKQPQVFPVPNLDELHNSAMLLNESGKAIVVLALVWRYKDADGSSRTTRLTNLSSSRQLEILSGRLRADQDLYTSILPGSKRLVIEKGLLGNNSDVLPATQPRGIRSSGGFGIDGSSMDGGQNILSTELSVDLAILENGLAVGPDTQGMFTSLSESIELQRTTAGKAVQALRSGASEGQVFEFIRPLARMPRPGADGAPPLTQLHMFSQMAINQLVNSTCDEQVSWFERFTEQSDFRLHRPL